MKKTFSALMLTVLLGGTGVALGAEQEASMEMPEHCRQMMERHQQMQQQSQQMDRELDALVKRMETASGEAKVEATAAVVSKFVEQRKSMRGEMMEMCSGMMGHTMRHMDGDDAKKGMMGCPMMKGMKAGMGMGGMHRMKHGDQKPPQDSGDSGDSR